MYIGHLYPYLSMGLGPRRCSSCYAQQTQSADRSLYHGNERCAHEFPPNGYRLGPAVFNTQIAHMPFEQNAKVMLRDIAQVGCEVQPHGHAMEVDTHPDVVCLGRDAASMFPVLAEHSWHLQQIATIRYCGEQHHVEGAYRTEPAGMPIELTVVAEHERRWMDQRPRAQQISKPQPIGCSIAEQVSGAIAVPIDHGSIVKAASDALIPEQQIGLTLQLFRVAPAVITFAQGDQFARGAAVQVQHIPSAGR